MKNLIEERISGLRGRYGVYIENLLSGGKLEVIKGQESDVFEAASIIRSEEHTSELQSRE